MRQRLLGKEKSLRPSQGREVEMSEEGGTLYKGDPRGGKKKPERGEASAHLHFETSPHWACKRIKSQSRAKNKNGGGGKEGDFDRCKGGGRRLLRGNSILCNNKEFAGVKKRWRVSPTVGVVASGRPLRRSCG